MPRVRKKKGPLPLFRLGFMMKLRKVSKRKLSIKTGIPYPMMIRMSKGRANPTWATVIRLARGLDCSPGDFDGRKRR